MPTADRPSFVEQSIRYLLRQDHPARELVVLDDGAERVEHLMPSDARIRYVGLDRPLILGAKRNLGCEIARGDVIVNWDDDDWMAPHRLRYQLEQLQRHAADACGLDRMLYFDPARWAAWLYEYPAGRRTWVSGNTLCFTRDSWRHDPFPEIAVGEDTRFIWSGSRRLRALDDHRITVGLVHPRNTSRKRTDDPWWRAAAPHDVERLLGEDAAFYARGSEGGCARPSPDAPVERLAEGDVA